MAMIGNATLIHPHQASNLPGYRGYTPQLKFQCGHTYGYQTDNLSRKHTRNDKLKHTVDANPKVLARQLPINGREDQKYVQQMVPGYTGFVPQHVFKYGQTYADGTEEAICESKHFYSMEASKQQDLRNTIKSRGPLPAIPDNSPPDTSHPGVNMRYLFSYSGNKFADKRNFTEAPIPGYQGYVPRKEEHILGEKYNVWTRHAYNHALENITAREKQKATQEQIDVGTINSIKSSQAPAWPLPDDSARFGSIYSKKLGMIPNYTGYVPQHRYDFGTTYGDSTRSMPVCSDTFGYSLGEYKRSGEEITPTVIPVRI